MYFLPNELLNLIYEYTNLKELQQIARINNIKIKGRKDELIERISQFKQ